jgi:hypothetical protein
MVQTTGATLASLWTVDAQTDEARVARPDLFEHELPGRLAVVSLGAACAVLATCLSLGVGPARARNS